MGLPRDHSIPYGMFVPFNWDFVSCAELAISFNYDIDFCTGLVTPLNHENMSVITGHDLAFPLHNQIHRKEHRPNHPSGHLMEHHPKDLIIASTMHKDLRSVHVFLLRLRVSQDERLKV